MTTDVLTSNLPHVTIPDLRKTYDTLQQRQRAANDALFRSYQRTYFCVQNLFRIEAESTLKGAFATIHAGTGQSEGYISQKYYYGKLIYDWDLPDTIDPRCLGRIHTNAGTLREAGMLEEVMQLVAQGKAGGNIGHKITEAKTRTGRGTRSKSQQLKKNKKFTDKGMEELLSQDKAILAEYFGERPENCRLVFYVGQRAKKLEV